MHRANLVLPLLVLTAAAAPAEPRIVAHAAAAGRDIQAVEDRGSWTIRTGDLSVPIDIPARARIDAVAAAG